MLWTSFFVPPDLTTALELKAKMGTQARFIAGGTDLIVDLENGRQAPLGLIDLSRLTELRFINLEADGLRLGAGLTHADLLGSPEVLTHAPLLAQAAIELGSPQIRNRSTLAGNLVTASPAADTVPPLYAYEARVELVSRAGRRELPVSQFVTGFRQIALAPDELIRSVFIPFGQHERRVAFLKLGLRKAQAISVVSVSALLEFDPAQVITKAKVVLGSVAPTPLDVPEAGFLLVGQTTLSEELINKVAEAARAAARPISDVRASAAYRQAMVKAYTARALGYIATNQIPPPSADPAVRLQISVPASVANPPAADLQEAPLELTVNGQPVQIEGAGETVLLYALRRAGFNGTKEGCFEGECGACTVLLDGKAVNSCLVPAATAHGCQVQTIEGLAQAGQLHPLQESFIAQGGVQCGFCTPGLLMAGATLLTERPNGVNEWECRSALVGNLCRCTGYGRVLASVQAASEGVRDQGSGVRERNQRSKVRGQ